MERNKLTIVILVSAFVIFFLALSLNPSRSTNTDSITPSKSVSKSWSPPARSLTKYFRYDYLDPMFDDHWYNIVGLAVNVSWYSMGGTHGPIFLGTYYTDHFGMIRLDDIPRGVYLIEYKWNGQIHSENLTVSSCMRDWFYWNELDAKGGDKAISFFHSTEHPMIFPIPSLTECILNSVHGELHQCQ